MRELFPGLCVEGEGPWQYASSSQGFRNEIRYRIDHFPSFLHIQLINAEIQYMCQAEKLCPNSHS